MNEYNLKDKSSVERLADRVELILANIHVPERREYAEEQLLSLAKEYMLPLVVVLHGVHEWKDNTFSNVVKGNMNHGFGLMEVEHE